MFFSLLSSRVDQNSESSLYQSLLSSPHWTLWEWVRIEINPVHLVLVGLMTLIFRWPTHYSIDHRSISPKFLRNPLYPQHLDPSFSYPAQANVRELPPRKTLVSLSNLTGTLCQIYMLPMTSLMSMWRHDPSFRGKSHRSHRVGSVEGPFCPLPLFNNLTSLLLHDIRCQTI